MLTSANFKSWSLNTAALGLAFLAVIALQLSYCLGGLNWLDALLMLLVPAFVLFVAGLFKSWTAETKDYCAGLVLMCACIIFALFYQSNVEVGTMDDDYHNFRIVALSLRNSFFTKLQYTGIDHMFFISEFVESVWGVFWRLTQTDFIITILQALPLLVLWHRLLNFFRLQKITAPALLAAVTVMSLPLLWSQMGSTFVDSLVGVFGGIALLLCYDVLKHPAQRTFANLAGLAFCGGLCLILKPTTLLPGLLSIVTAVIFSLRQLTGLPGFLAPAAAVPSVLYFLYHQGQVWHAKGSPLYPFVTSGKIGRGFDGWYHYYYEKIPFYSWIRDHAFNFKPFYVFYSWLLDYRVSSDMNPDPWVGGNGLVFTYFVIPILLLWLFKDGAAARKPEAWKNPALWVLAVIVLYDWNFDGSVGARLVLPFQIMILAWCLAWLWRTLESMPEQLNRFARPVLVVILVLLGSVSWLEGIWGKRLEPRMLSLLQTQKQIFPRYVRTEDLKLSLIQLLKSYGAYPTAWRGN